MKTTKKIDWKDILIVILDIIAVNISYLFALMTRFFENGEVSFELEGYLPYYFKFAPFFTVIAIAVFAYFRLMNTRPTRQAAAPISLFQLNSSLYR